MRAEALQSFRPQARNPRKTVDTEASNVLSNICPPDRAPAAQPATAGKPVAAVGCQAPSFAALLRAHVFIRPLQVAVIDAVSIRRTDQRERSWLVSCDVGWRWACLTAWRPPSVSGCWAAPVKAPAGPDGIGVGVVFAGDRPCEALAPHRYRGCRPVGPVRTRCWPVVPSQASLSSGPKTGWRCLARSVRSAPQARTPGVRRI